MNSHPRSTRSATITIAVLGSLGVLLMSVAGLIVGLQFQSQRFQYVSPWHSLTFIVSLTTSLQYAQILGWMAITGLLIAWGVNASTVTRVRAAAAIAAGALVPVGLVVFAHQLNRIWPDTTGPTEVPALTALLALYSLGVPWTLGRLLQRWVPAYRPTVDRPMTISQ